jgi:hypothetical protein
MTNRFAFSTAAALLALGLTAASAGAAPTIDGNVLGFLEGYTVGFSVGFDIESGPTDVPGGTLYLHETTTSLSVGFVAPLTINDNTYGANQASDWGGKNHKLKSLDGSDQWALVLPADGTGVSLTLDYITGATTNVYDAEVDAFKQGTANLPASGIRFESSLSYNFEVLGLTQFFDKANEKTIASPATGSGDYDFLPPAEDWIPEIMYEFSVDKSAFGGTLDIPSFLASLGVMHMSPNKLGKNMVFPKLGDPLFPPQQDVPEPATLLLFGAGLFGASRLCRRNR